MLPWLSVSICSSPRILPFNKRPVILDCTGPTRAGQEWIHHAGFVDANVLGKLTATYDPGVRNSSFRLHITEDLAAKVPEYEKENATGGLFIYKGDPSVSPTYCGATKIEGDFGKLLSVCYTQFSFSTCYFLVALTCGTWGKNSGDLPDNIEGVREFLKSDKSATAIPKWIWSFLDICEEAESTVLFNKVRIRKFFFAYNSLFGCRTNTGFSTIFLGSFRVVQ